MIRGRHDLARDVRADRASARPCAARPAFAMEGARGIDGAAVSAPRCCANARRRAPRVDGAALAMQTRARAGGSSVVALPKHCALRQEAKAPRALPSTVLRRRASCPRPCLTLFLPPPCWQPPDPRFVPSRPLGRLSPKFDPALPPGWPCIARSGSNACRRSRPGAFAPAAATHFGFTCFIFSISIACNASGSRQRSPSALAAARDRKSVV